MKKVFYRNFLKWENNLNKKDVLLDIGCWSGANTLKFNKKCNAFGMEIVKEKLDLAEDEIKLKLKTGDVTKEIPFNRKFDYIYLSAVIEHVDDDEKALHNISKSLKDGGTLILITPKKIKFLDFYDPAWVRWKLGFGPKHEHYSLNTMNKKLLKFNLKIEEYSIALGLDFLWKRGINIFLKHFLKSKKTIKAKAKDGSFDLCVIAKKIK